MTTERDLHLVPIGRLRAWLLLAFGPAASWDNPLHGTRYDPVLREHRDLERHQARRQRAEVRHQRHLLASPDSGDHSRD